MDAVTFVRDYARMCSSLETCAGCPLSSACMDSADLKEIGVDDIHRIVNAVAEWSKAHPIKTRLTDLLEKYPNVTVKGDGLPTICVSSLGYLKIDECCCSCEKCWNTPLEE